MSGGQRNFWERCQKADGARRLALVASLDRRDAIALLKWNDRDGVYSDEDMAKEPGVPHGFKLSTLECHIHLLSSFAEEDAEHKDWWAAYDRARYAPTPVCLACLDRIHFGGKPDFPWRNPRAGEACGAADHELNMSTPTSSSSRGAR